MLSFKYVMLPCDPTVQKDAVSWLDVPRRKHVVVSLHILHLEDVELAGGWNLAGNQIWEKDGKWEKIQTQTNKQKKVTIVPTLLCYSTFHKGIKEKLVLPPATFLAMSHKVTWVQMKHQGNSASTPWYQSVCVNLHRFAPFGCLCTEH